MNNVIVLSSALTILLTGGVAAVIALYFRSSSARNYSPFDSHCMLVPHEARKLLISELGGQLSDIRPGRSTVIHIFTICASVDGTPSSVELIRAIRVELLKRAKRVLKGDVSSFQINELQSAIVQNIGHISCVSSLETALDASVSSEMSYGNSIIKHPARVSSFALPADGSCVDHLVSQLEAMSRLTASSSFDEYSELEFGDRQLSRSGYSVRSDIYKPIPQTSITYEPVANLIDGSITGCVARLSYQNIPIEFEGLDIGSLSSHNYDLLLKAQRYLICSACSEFSSQDQISRLSVQCRVLHEDNNDFEKFIGRVLAQTGLAPDRLELEFDDSILIDFPRKSLECFARLRAMKVRVAVRISDAETVLSGALDLHHVNVLRLDPRVIRPMGVQSATNSDIRNLVKIADNHGILVRVDGVDTRQKLTRLQLLCCHEGKGQEIGQSLTVGLTARR